MSTALPCIEPAVAEIPRIIHQIFIAGPKDVVPRSYQEYAATWRANHPGWEYQLWDAKRARDLIAQHYSFFLPVYDGYRHRIQRVDAIRCFILHRFGGVYADMDVECRRPIDELIAGRELLLAGRTIGFNSAVIGSAPAHPLWPRVFDALRARRRRFAAAAPLWSKVTMPMYVGYSTGPHMLTDCLRDSGHANSDDPHVNICPSRVFEPAPGDDVSQSYAIHHMSMHWLPRRHRLLGFLLGVLARPFARPQKEPMNGS